MISSSDLNFLPSTSKGIWKYFQPGSQQGPDIYIFYVRTLAPVRLHKMNKLEGNQNETLPKVIMKSSVLKHLS